jgi:hypothetical protein
VNTAISPNDGSITNNGSFIGTKITVSKVVRNMSLALCEAGACPPNAFNTQYYPLDIPINPPAAVCPSTSAISCDGAPSTYLDNIQCSSQYQLSCGDTVGLGQIVGIENNNRTSLLAPAANGTQCLIHAAAPGNGLGQGQDVLSEPNGPGTPVFISGGENNPNAVFAASGPNSYISRSDSIVTVPIYDTTGSPTKPLDLCQAGGGGCNQTAKVVGFLQLGITQSNPPPAPPPPVSQNGSFEAYIVNVSGCNPSGSGNAVSGGGVSPVPVRLISQ